MLRGVARTAAAIVVLFAVGAGAAQIDPEAMRVTEESWQSSEAGTLTARLSSADDAMEYWDVTAWLDSGERFIARFLVTNQGPGDRTAAAVGYLVLANGDVLPFKWGRRSDGWTLGPGGRRLQIAKTMLDVDGPTIVVDINNRKHGVQVRPARTRSSDPVRSPIRGRRVPRRS